MKLLDHLERKEGFVHQIQTKMIAVTACVAVEDQFCAQTQLQADVTVNSGGVVKSNVKNVPSNQLGRCVCNLISHETYT